MSEEEVRSLIVEHRILEGSIRATQSRIDLINAALNDLYVANATLEGLRECENGVETLIPIGGGSFVKANLSTVQRVVMGVGAGVCVEKSVEESIMDLKTRQAELERARASLQEALGKALEELEKRQRRISELLQSRRGAPNVA
ncbi:MAG: prefoldin subunit alpha [Candidatus Bathyarchaeia archaeon]